MGNPGNLIDLMNQRRGMEVLIKRFRGEVVRGVVLGASATRIRLVDLQDGLSIVHVAVDNVEYALTPNRHPMA